MKFLECLSNITGSDFVECFAQNLFCKPLQLLVGEVF